MAQPTSKPRKYELRPRRVGAVLREEEGGAGYGVCILDEALKIRPKRPVFGTSRNDSFTLPSPPGSFTEQRRASTPAESPLADAMLLVPAETVVAENSQSQKRKATSSQAESPPRKKQAVSRSAEDVSTAPPPPRKVSVSKQSKSSRKGANSSVKKPTQKILELVSPSRLTKTTQTRKRVDMPPKSSSCSSDRRVRSKKNNFEFAGGQVKTPDAKAIPTSERDQPPADLLGRPASRPMFHLTSPRFDPAQVITPAIPRQPCGRNATSVRHVSSALRSAGSKKLLRELTLHPHALTLTMDTPSRPSMEIARRRPLILQKHSITRGIAKPTAVSTPRKPTKAQELPSVRKIAPMRRVTLAFGLTTLQQQALPLQLAVAAHPYVGKPATVDSNSGGVLAGPIPTPKAVIQPSWTHARKAQQQPFRASSKTTCTMKTLAAQAKTLGISCHFTSAMQSDQSTRTSPASLGDFSSPVPRVAATPPLPCGQGARRRPPISSPIQSDTDEIARPDIQPDRPWRSKSVHFSDMSSPTSKPPLRPMRRLSQINVPSAPRGPLSANRNQTEALVTPIRRQDQETAEYHRHAPSSSSNRSLGLRRGDSVAFPPFKAPRSALPSSSIASRNVVMRQLRV